MTENRTVARLRVLALLVLFMFLALTTRLWFLQVMASEHFRSQASQNAVRLVELPAPRGRILDDKGLPIVDNQFSLQVTIDRDKVRGHEEQVLFELSNLLKIDVPTLTKRFESNRYLPYAPVPVAFNVSKEVAFAIGEYPDKFNGVSVEKVPDRQYLYGETAAHILGYVGPINDKQYGTPAYEGYDPNDYVGQSGLEQQYESYLHGTKGAQKLRINAAGKMLGKLGEQESAVPGNDIKLNIDIATQKYIEQSLQLGMAKAQAAGYPADAGAVVVMDPSNGAIKAITSMPTFSPSIYNGGLSEDEMHQLGLRPHQNMSNPPLLNRAMDGLYPLGSAIKPFVAMSALREGFVNENTQIPCPAEYKVAGDVSGNSFKNWAYPADMGYMNLREALVMSCDTVFYRLADRYYWPAYVWPSWPQPLPAGQQPKELMQRDLSSFGFGQDPGIDFPSAQQGRVPDLAWKQQQFGPMPQPQRYCDWNLCPGDFIFLSIGQGNLASTPLQLARGFGAIATGGKLCQPRLAADAERNGRIVTRFQPECHQLPNYTAQSFRYVRQGLEGVPRQGTASSAFIGFPFDSLDYFGGKTGTAQVPGKQDFSWFAGIAKGKDAKGDNHEYVVVALVEQAGHGSETAAPIVRQVVDQLFGLHDNAALSIGQVAD